LHVLFLQPLCLFPSFVPAPGGLALVIKIYVKVSTPHTNSNDWQWQSQIQKA
jgi:hypothetical protein